MLNFKCLFLSILCKNDGFWWLHSKKCPTKLAKKILKNYLKRFAGKNKIKNCLFSWLKLAFPGHKVSLLQGGGQEVVSAWFIVERALTILEEELPCCRIDAVLKQLVAVQPYVRWNISSLTQVSSRGV